MSHPADAATLAGRLRDGDLAAAAAVLNLLEGRGEADRESADALQAALSPAALGREAPGAIIGITGPPGVGKSSLLSRLAGAWRADGRTVAVLAVDPSSRRSGGALLGDRARIDRDARDDGLFIRSTAAGDRLGGLAPATRAAATVLAVAFDVVVVETVGVGQSETDVADLADTVAVIVQPGSGDVLQFLKSGIMEIPDVLVVTKADLGRPALRTRADLSAALRSLSSREPPVIAVSSIAPPAGIAELIAALDEHRASIQVAARRLQSRRHAALADVHAELGDRGLRALGGRRAALATLGGWDPMLDSATLARMLRERAVA
ncbi:MAG TPA: ArgK protein [Solirubrobacteraceae bacterium]